MSAITRKTDRKGRLTLPTDFADHLVLIERVGDDELRIKKAKAVHKGPSLKDLVAQITPDNRHEEVDFGPATGEGGMVKREGVEP